MGDKGSTRRHRAMTGTPTPSPTPSAGFTMTQFAAHEAKRIYQRATTTGGGQGKGQGVIRIALTGASAGTVGARIRSDDGSTILQPEWIAASRRRPICRRSQSCPSRRPAMSATAMVPMLSAWANS
ncbi:hypothetical protein FHS91_000375 [Sphingobium xanthum]